MEAILDGLNDAQKSAVTTQASVAQVLAPPGSGKTKTLTARVAYLVNHARLQPWNIIVCTFTIKAAREMKERIRGMVGNGIESKLILGTFHSVARRFLVRYGQEIGIDKNFGIADTSDSQAIIKRIVTRRQYSMEPPIARSRISGLKAKGTTAEQYAATSKQVDQHEFANLYSEYEETLKASNLLDYDDLLLRCTDLLQKSPACVSTIQAVLIDEYQDTNNVQYDLMKLMAQAKKHIMIVGDPDQSIYSFRSAEIKNLHRMRTDYPDTIVINLENNYRSSGCILSSALAVIEQDEGRPRKPLLATHCVGEQPTLRHLATAAVEAQWIVDEIHRSRSLTAGLLDFSDYAILLRSASLSLSIERALGKAGIPYRMVGGKRFFDRAEIKIVLDYLRVINQPDHNDALVRIINVPSRKIGDVTVKGLLEEAEGKKVTLWSLILNCAQGRSKPSTKISSSAQKGIDQFVNLILTSRRKLIPAEGEECNLLDLISHILQKTAFEKYLKDHHQDNWKDRWANVEELVVQATQMASMSEEGDAGADEALPIVEGIEQRQDTAADLLTKFLANVALSTEIERGDGETPNQVTISTIHAAKGLEWPIVFMPAVYDGSIPHSRAEDHDEERRLLYDLAQILRRPMPTTAEVEAARTTLQRVDDDQYPLTREEIDGEGQSFAAAKLKNDASSRDGAPPSFKRRRVDEPARPSGMQAQVTMQSTSSFSVSTTTMHTGNAGFTSASIHHKILQEAEDVRRLVSAQNVPRKRALQSQEPKADAKTSRQRTIKPRPAGQGSITSFFGRSGSNASDKSDPEPSAPVKVPTLFRSQSSTSSTAPLSDRSNVQIDSVNAARPYKPPILSSYRPRNAPMASKPKRTTPEPDIQGKRYVLLSSSPVKAEENKPPQRSGDEGDVFDESESPPKAPATAGATSYSGFRAASTLHTTSVGQVQNQSAPQRKTLGMRRTVQPWTVKHQKPPRPQL
ncbi:P-loop containing nucleoside triphosphate hydrolase protein [Lophiotrema nucula]|uniref:DNA 3'-5' helicase n=1 Tax=Lophiotrema nucula TaxID=690887 RepID=A0A6A5YTP3_9PLEO|nr:P-loop containing nucleoside triphosphate hydrolase protein [Lophiotrema nucula]